VHVRADRVLELPDPRDQEPRPWVLADHLGERCDHVAVALRLGQAADRQPGEAIAQVERGTHPRAGWLVAFVGRGREPVRDDLDRACRRRAAPLRFELRDPTHRSRDVGQRVGEPVGEIPPLCAFILVVHGRDHDGRGRNEPRQPPEQVRVDHVRVKDIGSPPPHESPEAQQSARVGLPLPHAE